MKPMIMDEQVRRAMAKWPQVPACYGWLGLDARGEWRMRDQRCQDLGLLGDKINNRMLRDFINRNYLSNENGQYFFQNGPQQVFVRLEATPYIVRSSGSAEAQTGTGTAHNSSADPTHWLLHTGIAMPIPEIIWLTADGQLLMQNGTLLAQVDDRDMSNAITHLNWHGQAPSDQQLLDWLSTPQSGLFFLFEQNGTQHPVPVQSTTLTELAHQLPFITDPQSTPAR